MWKRCGHSVNSSLINAFYTTCSCSICFKLFSALFIIMRMLLQPWWISLIWLFVHPQSYNAFVSSMSTQNICNDTYQLLQYLYHQPHSSMNKQKHQPAQSQCWCFVRSPLLLTHWGRVTQICVFNTRLFSLHNTRNYAIHRTCLRMVLLTDVYRNLTSLWINL